MSSGSTWRKRVTCQRCHNLKVRCEYASPTSFVCVRCEKSKSECVLPMKAKKSDDSLTNEDKSLQVNPKIDEAIYLTKIVTEAERKLAQLHVSLLQQACHNGFTTWDIAQTCYDLYKQCECVAPFMSTLRLPDNIMELDRRLPKLAYALLMIRYFHSEQMTNNNLNDFYKSMSMIEEFKYPDMAIDNVLSYAVICRYALPTNELGAEFLLSFHAKSLSAVMKYNKLGNMFMVEYSKWMSLLTIMPYTLIEEFSSLRCMYQFYKDNVLSDGVSFCDRIGGASINNDALTTISAAHPLLQLMDMSYAAIIEIKRSQSFEEVNQILNQIFKDLRKLENCLVIYKNEIMQIDKKCGDFSAEMLTFPIWTADMIAECKILRITIFRLLELIYTCSNEEELLLGRQLLFNTINQLNDLCTSIIRAFAKYGPENPVVPTWCFYLVPECLKLMHMARIASFAACTANNIRPNCMLEVVTVTWNELAKTSILAKKFYLNLFQVQGLLYTRVGSYNSYGAVDGPGDMANFWFFYDNGKPEERQQVEMTHSQLLELIISQSREAYTAKPADIPCHMSALNVDVIVKEHWNLKT